LATRIHRSRSSCYSLVKVQLEFSSLPRMMILRWRRTRRKAFRKRKAAFRSQLFFTLSPCWEIISSVTGTIIRTRGKNTV